MGRFIKGDVVILPFPFSNLKGSRRRPGLIISTPKDDEVIICQITSQQSRNEYVIPLEENDFAQGRLKLPSFIRPNHIFMAEPTIIEYSAGRLKKEKLSEVIERLIKILKEK